MNLQENCNYKMLITSSFRTLEEHKKINKNSANLISHHTHGLNDFNRALYDSYADELQNSVCDFSAFDEQEEE